MNNLEKFSSPVISICIVSYNSGHYLQQCLGSLGEAPRKIPLEIIVADNHSEDGTLDILKDQYPGISLIINPENEGFAKAMNKALRTSSGKFILLLNPDTRIINGAIDNLVRYLDENPAAGIVGPKILNGNGTLQKQCRRSEGRPWDAFCHLSGLGKLFPNKRKFNGYLLTYIDDSQITEVEAVSGACMLIRREVIDDIGLLDELFFAYQEDSDFCLRARQAGWKVHYYPKVEVIHYGGQGGAGVRPYKSLLEWHRSYYRYYRKHFAKDSPGILNLSIYSLIAVKYIFTLPILVFRKNKFVGSKKP